MAKKFLKQFTLSKENFDKNLDKFKEIQEKYKPFTEELLEYLTENGFFSCPATTTLTLYNCFEGGLIDHILRVGKYATQLNKLLPVDLQQEISSIIKVVFNHSIGKVGLYEDNDSKWHKENLSQYYKYKENQEDAAMRVNEKSAYLAMNYGVKLTDYEYQATLGWAKPDEDKQAKFFSDPLTIILKQAIQLSILEEQLIFNKFQNE